MEKIILASASPRRHQLLRWAEIEFDVIAICCDFSEDSFENIADQYGIELDPEMDEDYQKQQVIEHLEGEGAYVGDSINGIVYRNF